MSSLVSRYAEYRFSVLFAMLLLCIGGHALAGRMLPVVNPLEWLLGLALVAAVLSARSGAARVALAVLVIGSVGARLVQPILEDRAPLIVGQAALASACVVAAGVAVHRALGAGPVDTQRIFAALDVYLLVGIAFGVTYWLIETWLPGSFSLGHETALTPPRAIYFSFVTQATLGYGDIVPVGEEAQGLVLVQGVSGQLYLAVLIARLVGLHSAKPRV